MESMGTETFAHPPPLHPGFPSVRRQGGTVAISISGPGPDDTTGFTWRLRRTGTGEDGAIYMVHEATPADGEAQVQWWTTE